MTDPNAPEATPPPKKIVVYVCPTEDCGNYYAAPTFIPARTDLKKMQHHRSQNDGALEASHTRLECPDCRTIRNLHVERVPYVVTQVVSFDAMLAHVIKTAEPPAVAV